MLGSYYAVGMLAGTIGWAEPLWSEGGYNRPTFDPQSLTSWVLSKSPPSFGSELWPSHPHKQRQPLVSKLTGEAVVLYVTRISSLCT